MNRMNIRCDEKPSRDRNRWQRRFALMPRRVSPTHVCWLGFYWSRWVKTASAIECQWGYEERAPFNNAYPTLAGWQGAERER